ncbi:MAG: hypothetical protein ACKVU2_09375 [Saprospiraceae bacterium]
MKQRLFIALRAFTVCYLVGGPVHSGGQTPSPCQFVLQNCPRPLVELAKDFVGSKDPDCKYWHGPCASENKAWREGQVYLGAGIFSYSGGGGTFNLLVKGGITTEMLQICVPEWCDYVFSDTFRLMPLPKVEEFTKANGHLPGCTPGHVIEGVGGFFLDKEVVSQQEKIEEIFLHLFDLRKRLEALKLTLPSTAEIKSQNPVVSKDAQTTVGDVPPPAVPAIVCYQVSPAQASTPNGVGGIQITPGPGPFNLSWAGGQLNNILCSGPIQIENLTAGLYNVTVSDASGIVGSCAFTISLGSATDCTMFADPACKAAILAMLEAEAFGTPANCLQWEGPPCSSTNNLSRFGKVGIGTSVVPSNYSLAVKGGISSDKIRIELCESANWCDYVFDPKYPLLPLAEVEAFVRKNRHLPGMVTQGDVTRDGGFELRAVTLDQQEKIEEAFLYLIQLDKQKKEIQERLTR